MPNLNNRRPLNSLFLVGALLLSVFVIIAVFGPIMFSSSADVVDPQNGRLTPSGAHLLGTDSFGRDILSRVLVATRLTLILTFGSSLIAVGIGTLVGVTVWLVGRRTRNMVLQLNTVAVAFPSMVLALVVAAIMGPGSLSAMLAVGIAGVPTYIRLTASMSQQVVSQDFVSLARLQGVPTFSIAVRHVLPNIAIPLSVMAANSTAFTLVELSSLSFIGLGVQAPDYDFGKLLNDGLAEMGGQPWGVFGPSIAIVLLGLAIMLFGDGLAAMIDPKVAAKRNRMRRGLREIFTIAPRHESCDARQETNAVSVKNLSVGTLTPGGEQHAIVRGVSFDIAPGEILGIVGESGSGKSLTAMTVAGLTPAGLWSTADELTVEGINMFQKNDDRILAQNISLVYQDPMSTFSPSLRMGAQLSDVFRQHLKWGKKKTNDSLLQAFESVSISEPGRRLRQFPHELSGGLLQRTLIAQSILIGPRLLIADEPTTALDVSVQADVLRKIYAFRSETGAGVLFISHDLAVVEALCDRVLVMYQGEFVEELRPDQIRTGDVEHPYTRRLLKAALYFDRAATEPSQARKVEL